MTQDYFKRLRFTTIIFLLISLFIVANSFAFTITVANSYKTDRESIRVGTVTFDSSYPNTGATIGEALTAANINLSTIRHITFQPTSGYLFEYDYTNSTVKAYTPTGAQTSGAEAAHTHAIALDSGASAAGASHNHAFTGTASTGLNLATPAWSGTGLTAAGQNMTTTDTQTMTLNEAAGMWLIPATGATPPMLILSNTAVTGAAAVLTVQGSASTDAGAYKIVKATTPAGTNAAEATHTHASGTLADAASAAGSSHTHAVAVDAADQVANGSSALNAIAVKFYAVGY